MGSFENQAVADVTRLRNQFSMFRGENVRKANYYDGKQRLKDLGISLPPSMRSIDTVVGWPGTAVDVLEERLDFEGWSDSQLDSVFQQNDLDVSAPTGHLDALIYGTGFVTVTSGRDGEPDVVVSVASPMSMTGTRDARTNRLSEAVHIIDNDDDTERAVLYRPDETVWLSSGGRGWVVDEVDEHKLGRVMVAQMVNRPRASKSGGRSEITPAVRSYTDMALRTLVGAEVAREFYAVPQRFMMGAPESFFMDEDGNPRGAWDAMMGKILAIERDEDTGEIPTVGSFAANSTSPFFEQLRNLSQLLASETSIPPTYLGFVTDNPSSADAIRMSENRLVKRAERRQAMFGKAWTEVGRLALMVRDGRSYDDLTDEELAIRPLWRDPSTPTRAAATDQVVKLVSIGVPFGDYAMKLLGMSPQDKAMLERDKAASLRSALMDSIRSRAEGGTDPLADELSSVRVDPADGNADEVAREAANTVKAKADAMGVLIRAGVKFDSAMRAVGLSDLEFHDAKPNTLTYAGEEE